MSVCEQTANQRLSGLRRRAKSPEAGQLEPQR